MAVEPGEIVLRLTQAARRYGNRPALDRVDLELREGEVYALVGRNGAGKSTLAKAAIGLLALDSGEVRVLGADPNEHRAVRREIGIAPQEIALYPHLTIAENLAAFAALAGLPLARNTGAVGRAMADTACAERAGERIDQLSGGWRRRANLAAAIVHRPRLLVLDEPTEGLDTETRQILRHLIETLRAERTAILLITHNAEDVAALADRVGIIDGGRLIAEGHPADLLAAAFGGRTELIVRLSAPAPSVEPMLTAAGLASEDNLLWTGLVLDAVAEAHKIEVALRPVAVEVTELRVQPPALDALIAWAAAGKNGAAKDGTAP
jgi:ABC-2 type transport system ATP-binding protein